MLNVHGNQEAYLGRGEGGKGYGDGEEGDYILIATRIISTLRWAAMRAILMFHNCEGQIHKTVSTDHNF